MNRPRPGGLLGGRRTVSPGAGAVRRHAPAARLQPHRRSGVLPPALLVQRRDRAVPFLGSRVVPAEAHRPAVAGIHAVPDGRRLVRGAPGGAARLPALAAQLADDERPRRASTTSGWSSADASKTTLAATGELQRPGPFTIDNRTPARGLQTSSAGAWSGAPGISAANTYTWPFVVHRDRARPQATDIEIEVSWSASAIHFRSACAQRRAVAVPATRPSRARCRLHLCEPAGSTGTRTSWTTTSRGRRCTASPARCPRARTASRSTPTRRAFNPAGDGGGPGTNWLDDYNYIHVNPSVSPLGDRHADRAGATSAPAAPR